MKFLAFDTSTEVMSIAVQQGDAVFAYTGAGGAQASTSLIPTIEALMAQAGLRYEQLDAIVFGRGPGSFTGLRTACSVAQGLALGANVKVLPIDTLLVVAQEAHWQLEQQGKAAVHVLAALDARMGEAYVQNYEFNSKFINEYADQQAKSTTISLLKLPSLALAVNAPPSGLILAGNLRPSLDAALPPSILALPHVSCLPTARAMLTLAPDLLNAGLAVDAEHALPLYIRDKVALTTAEREAKI
jgi:tRNA threonylcarbamoyladenosine biosynthesis protein TsaB